MYQLHYNKIPSKWINGLPIGNGRLAAMYWGDGATDILSLNHEYLWRGRYKNREADKVAEHLPVLRDLLKKRDYCKATMYANTFFAGNGGGDVNVGRGHIDSFQPAGNLIFKLLTSSAEQKCHLDIMNGLAEVERDNTFSSQFFCDSEDGCVMAQWKSSQPFSGRLYFEREADADAQTETTYTQDGVVFRCCFVCGISYTVRVAFKTDGMAEAREDGIYINDSRELICSVNILLSGEDERQHKLDFDGTYAAHCTKFKTYMERMRFELDAEDCDLPTDERIRRIREGKADDKLTELYFHYGRYLMISSCICGKLPPNLQGKWNLELTPPWNADYHLDINLQMNEWMLESANLSEFAVELTDFLLTFIESGRTAARNLYGCRGIWMTHAADVWGRCTPESIGYAVWVGAAAWAAQAMWQHYVYTGDVAYLRDKAYRFFKEVALFYEDFLEEDENGIMQIMPSQSPENRFVGAGNLLTVGICSSSAIDVQLAYDALGYAACSAEILGIDADEAKIWTSLRDKLPEFKIGSDGRLLEWNEEFEEEQPGHKHLSHLYGLYPSNIFTPAARKAEYDAAVKSFRYRLSHESGYTGWSRAWIANICARIGDADTYYEQVKGLLCDFATESLLDIHPDPLNPGVGPDIFQIDGNFGMVSGVTEALCSYFDDCAHFLHALPEQWSSGRLTGMKLPGGHEVSFSWHSGRLTELSVIVGFGGSLKATVNGNAITISGSKGEKQELRFT